MIVEQKKKPSLIFALGLRKVGPGSDHQEIETWVGRSFGLIQPQSILEPGSDNRQEVERS